MEIKGFQNLQDTALAKRALKNGASRSFFMSLGLKGWRIILTLELMPCSTLSVHVSFATQKAKHCSLCTSNALQAALMNLVLCDCRRGSSLPSGVAGKEGQPWTSLLTWSLPLYIFFFALVFLFDCWNHRLFSGLSPPWSFSLGWPSRESHIPTLPSSSSVEESGNAKEELRISVELTWISSS